MEGNGIAAYIILLALGIIFVVKGGDWFVDAASWIAEVSGIPTFIIGATIVSVATTIPEILVSSISAAQGQASMAIGNAVGSVNCNIALIMAISLVFTAPVFKRKDYVFKVAILLGTIALLWGLSASGEFNWWNAIIILAMFVLFLIENVISAKKHSQTLINDKGFESIDENKTKGEGILFSYFQKQESKKIVLKKTGMVIEKKDIAKKRCSVCSRCGNDFCRRATYVRQRRRTRSRTQRPRRHHRRYHSCSRHVFARTCHRNHRYHKEKIRFVGWQHHRRKHHRLVLDSSNLHIHHNGQNRQSPTCRPSIAHNRFPLLPCRGRICAHSISCHGQIQTLARSAVACRLCDLRCASYPQHDRRNQDFLIQEPTA